MNKYIEIDDVIDLIDAYLDNSPIEFSAEEILTELRSKMNENKRGEFGEFEAEIKANAFDVLKEYITISKFDIGTKKVCRAYVGGVDGVIELKEDTYEILKKAGVE